MMKRYWLLGGLILILILAACNNSTLPEIELASEMVSTENSIEWNGKQGLDSEDCSKADENRLAVDGDGWMHWVLTQPGNSTDHKLIINGNDEYDPGPPFEANVIHFYTPFYDLDTLTAKVTYQGSLGNNPQLVISDWCEDVTVIEDTLNVQKTAETSFTRTHNWSITKSVDPEEILLYIPGQGEGFPSEASAEWTVEVTYEGFEDSGFTVSGDITITNPETSKTTFSITSVIDDLGVDGFDDIDLECVDEDDNEVTFSVEHPYNLAPGKVLVCSYSVTDDALGEEGNGTNTVMVFVEGFEESFDATEDWEFDEPTEELHATVSVVDTNDGFAIYGDNDGNVILKASDYDAGDKITFTYTETFKWDDYGQDKCGEDTIINTASILDENNKPLLDDEGKPIKATATLTIKIQCYIFESAWAKGKGDGVTAKAFCDNGFNNWGWSNLISPNYTGKWPLYAGAGQCDINKGTKVGYFHVTYTNGSFSYEFKYDAGILGEGEAVYADTGMLPTVGRNRFTTAPGQYYIASVLSGDIHVIAHANVGIPDPNFGH